MQLCLSLCLSVCAMCGAYVAPPTWTYLHLISLTAASGYVDLSVCLSVYMTEAAPYGQQASFLQVMADLSVCLSVYMSGHVIRGGIIKVVSPLCHGDSPPPSCVKQICLFDCAFVCKLYSEHSVNAMYTELWIRAAV